MWRKQVQGDRNGRRFTVFWSAEKELEARTRLESKKSGSNCSPKIVQIVSLLMQSEVSSPNVLWQAQKTWQLRTWEPGLIKEEFRCSEMLWVCSKSYHCYETTFNKLNLRSKGLKKRKLVQNGDVPPEKNLKLLDDRVNFTYINRSFRTKDKTAAFFKQTKRGFFYFFSERKPMMMDLTHKYWTCHFSSQSVNFCIAFAASLYTSVQLICKFICFLLWHNQIIHAKFSFSCLQIK